MKDVIYRIGDTIKIINPIFVLRVGYPTTWPMLIEEFENHPKLQEAMRLLLLPESEQNKNDALIRDLYPTFNPQSKIARDFISGVAKAANRLRGFGGRERQMFVEELPSARNHAAEVLSKRTVKTGVYFAPSSFYSYEGEYDYEPGGLSNEKTHVLLSTVFGEIERVNVELVDRKERSRRETKEIKVVRGITLS